MRNALRIELTDTTDSAYRFSEDQLGQAIMSSISLMSRYLPRRRILEKVVPSDQAAENVTIASGIGYTTYKPVKTITLTAGGTTYVMDTNYSFDYFTGKITVITGMADGIYVAAYTVDKSVLYFGGDLSDFIRVERVEYPVAQNPASFITFEEIENCIIIKGENTLSATKHVRLYYLCKHTPPTMITNGSYPTSLDQAIITGAIATIMLMQSHECLDLAMDYFTDVKTDVGSMTAPIGAATTALGSIAAEITASKGFLTAGTPLINKPNAGDRVAENYASFAQMEANLAQLYLNESERRIAVSKEYFNQANIKAELINRYIAMHEHYKAAGEAKLNLFFNMIGFKPELPVTSVSSNQAVSS